MRSLALIAHDNRKVDREKVGLEVEALLIARWGGAGGVESRLEVDGIIVSFR